MVIATTMWKTFVEKLHPVAYHISQPLPNQHCQKEYRIELDNKKKKIAPLIGLFLTGSNKENRNHRAFQKRLKNWWIIVIEL